MHSVLERAGGCADSSNQGTPNHPRRDSEHENKLDLRVLCSSKRTKFQAARDRFYKNGSVFMTSDDSQTSAQICFVLIHEQGGQMSNIFQLISSSNPVQGTSGYSTGWLSSSKVGDKETNSFRLICTKTQVPPPPVRAHTSPAPPGCSISPVLQIWSMGAKHLEATVAEMSPAAPLFPGVRTCRRTRAQSGKLKGLRLS